MKHLFDIYAGRGNLLWSGICITSGTRARTTVYFEKEYTIDPVSSVALVSILVNHCGLANRLCESDDTCAIFAAISGNVY